MLEINPISEVLKRLRERIPRTPRIAFGGPYFEPPSLKSCIRPSTVYSLIETDMISLCKPASISYDLDSSKYFARKTLAWNSAWEN